jgi:hypothetical protein
MVAMFLSDVVMDSPVVEDSTSVVKKLLVAQDMATAAPSTSTVPPHHLRNNAPNTFPNYVLGRQQQQLQHQDGNSRNIVDLNTVPPPPFSSRSVTAMTADQVKMIKMMKATTNTELSPTSEKAIEKNQNMTSMNKKETTTKQSSRRDTSNHIITPSSATISALTAEIRSQAMKQEEQQQKKQDEEKESSSSQPADEKKAEKESSEPQDKSSSSSSTTTATKGLAQFASAMEASQTSQQNIHDWDKKFGLRRAHSKTMRESCRSRKKVLDFLKREIKDGKGSVLSALLASSITSSSSSSSTATTPLRESSATTATGTTTSDDVIDEKIDEMDEDSHTSSNTENLVRKEEGEGENDDGELEILFRRASLDCVDDMLSKEQRSLLLLQKQHQASSRSTSDSSSDSKSSANMLMHVMPPPQDTDRKQYHAKSA